MRYSVILVPDDSGRISVSLPALPGCVSVGTTREEALAHAREAIDASLRAETAGGHAPPPETRAIVAAGVAEALEIVEDRRVAGELPEDRPHELSVVSLDIQPSVAWGHGCYGSPVMT